MPTPAANIANTRERRSWLDLLAGDAFIRADVCRPSGGVNGGIGGHNDGM